MPYPFWEKNRADVESYNAIQSRREANESKNRLETIRSEIEHYLNLKPEERTNEELMGILDRIAKLLPKIK